MLPRSKCPTCVSVPIEIRYVPRISATTSNFKSLIFFAILLEKGTQNGILGAEFCKRNNMVQVLDVITICAITYYFVPIRSIPSQSEKVFNFSRF